MLRGQLQKGGFVGLGFNARQHRHIGQRATGQSQGLLQALRSAETLVEASRELLEPLLQAAFSLDLRLSDVQLPRAEQLNSRLLDGLQQRPAA